MKAKFYVMRRSAGYIVKSFFMEEAARAFSELNPDYIVCVYRYGIMEEI